MNKRRVLLSAFACDPSKGSEPGNGWNWSVGLANMGFEVHCITRVTGKSVIEKTSYPSSLKFHFIKLPIGLEFLYGKSQATMYLHYLIWQLIAFMKARRLHKKHGFSVAHHVTWGSIQLGSFLYRLPIPFVFGPAGGGQKAPEAFKKYFKKSWKSEIKREKVSNLLIRINPACKPMLAKATAIWVSNPDTADLVKKNGGKNVLSTLDAALPKSFFPLNFTPKKSTKGMLRLLWVGRFLPRKGTFLLLEVMNHLRNYPGITLTIVGDGEQREEILQKINILDLGNKVFWKGKVMYEAVKEYYSKHDVFFFTSLRDSCPAQLIEAMAYGLPVVTIDLHGQSIIVNDDTGFRCTINSPEQAIDELSKAILKLYCSPLLFTKMSEAAHTFAIQQTWDYKIKSIVEQCYPK